MKKLISIAMLALALAVLLLGSCSDDYRLDRREDKLIGSWEFEKAFFKENDELFRDDVTNDFAGDIIDFFGNYEAVYDDRSARQAYDGDWELILDRSTYDDETDVEFYLDMRFYDPDFDETFGYFAAVNLLTENKLNLRASTATGVYTFKLRRID